MTRRGRGPRQARRAQQRRRRRRQGLVAFFGVSALLTALILGTAWLGQRLVGDGGGAPPPTPTEVAAAEQDTLLLIRTGRDEGAAQGVTLLASEPGGRGVVLFIPVGTLVDIPGFGLDQLGLAHQYGGATLVEASVENLLGIDIDHVAAASRSGLAAFVERTGGLEVELDDQLVSRGRDGSAEVRFEPGVQFLDGERLLEYWAFRQRGEQELASFPRQQLVWSELLTAAADEEVLTALVDDGAPQLDTTAPPRFLRTMFEQLAAAQTQDRLTYTLLPVSPFGGDDAAGDTYRPTAAGIEDLVAGPLAGSVPTGGGGAAIRVQVLNGVGTPGIGQEVDERLEGTGVRIVLTDNARSFDFDETLILVYREDERSLDAARAVQQQLGVGTIQVSRQPQSVVDLTIVVGADFESEGVQATPEPTEEQTT